MSCANPLFEKWLMEWIDKVNDPLKSQYEKALESLRKFPLSLHSGKECIVLQHFDRLLCTRLDRKLIRHSEFRGKNENYPESTLTSSGVTSYDFTESGIQTNVRRSHSESNSIADKIQNGQRMAAVDLNKKTYEPRYRSGPFALLVCLFKQNMGPESQGICKGDLISRAQEFCDASLSKPLPGSHYSAWSSMALLLSKKLVSKQSNPVRFSLTECGLKLAEKLSLQYRLKLIYEPVQPSPRILPLVKCSADILAPSKRGGKKRRNEISQESQPTDSESIEDDTGPDYFLPHSFDIILLVDSCETIGVAKRSNDEMIQELTKMGINFEVRRLKVGDFLWIAKQRESSRELVLPFIVERKRMDDFSHSIKDGRFHEQKFRLKKCGLNRVIYLIEYLGRKEYHGLPLSSLLQAATNTQVVDQFSLKITQSHSDSIAYLSYLTNIFTELFLGKTLFCCQREDLSKNLDLEDYVFSLCSYKEFSLNSGKSRNFTVSEMFLKQLVQLYGVSSDKAWCIVEKYPTPLCLTEAFIEGGEKILENLTYGHLNRKLGLVTSRILYNFFTKQTFKT